jgi:hypothetical protein
MQQRGAIDRGFAAMQCGEACLTGTLPNENGGCASYLRLDLNFSLSKSTINGSSSSGLHFQIRPLENR